MSIPRTAAVGTDGPAQQWTKAGPVAGPLPVPDLSALLAFYAASAEVLNATYGRNVLPLFGRA